jgi:hypothetical protein
MAYSPLAGRLNLRGGYVTRETGMRSIAIVVLTGALLAGCGSSSNVESVRQDQQDYLRRQQDCANPQWKAAHEGLWYNVCRSNKS